MNTPNPALPTRPRLHEIDFVRGAALFGILMVNMPYHGLPMEVASGIPPLADRAGLIAWGVVRVFFEFKFFSLFSLLFGMSLVLLRDSLLARTSRWLPAMSRRLGFLFAVGLLHGVVLFDLDVLLPYAVLGALALVAFRLPARTTVILAVGLLVLAAALSVNGEFAGLTEASRAPVGVTPFQGLITLQDLLPNDFRSFTSIELRVYRQGPLWAAVAARGGAYGMWLFLSTLYSEFNARILALMLFGIVLMRVNVFDRRWRALRRRVGLAGLFIGLPLEIASAVLVGANPARPVIVRVAITLAHDIGSLALSAALATALIAWAQSNVATTFRLRIAATGRMAFTNYLTQSVVANLLFSGLGLAWYGQRSLVQLAGCAVLLYAVQVAASGWWLERRAMGPLEWVWRWATYLTRPPFRKSVVAPGLEPGTDP